LQAILSIGPPTREDLATISCLEHFVTNEIGDDGPVVPMAHPTTVISVSAVGWSCQGHWLLGL